MSLLLFILSWQQHLGIEAESSDEFTLWSIVYTFKIQIFLLAKLPPSSQYASLSFVNRCFIQVAVESLCTLYCVHIYCLFVTGVRVTVG